MRPVKAEVFTCVCPLHTYKLLMYDAWVCMYICIHADAYEYHFPMRPLLLLFLDVPVFSHLKIATWAEVQNPKRCYHRMTCGRSSVLQTSFKLLPHSRLSPKNEWHTQSDLFHPFPHSHLTRGDPKHNYKPLYEFNQSRNEGTSMAVDLRRSDPL